MLLRLDSRLASVIFTKAQEAANLINTGYEATIADKIVTYDFARQMQDAKEVKTSEFATAIIERMDKFL